MIGQNSNERRILVGIGEMAIGESDADLLIASSLGSCLGVAVFERRLKIGGLIHCFLPLSQSDPAKAKERPATYVDTGVTALLQEILSRGGSKKELVIGVAGGSAINDANGVFEIGSRNFTVLRKLLWKNNLLLAASDVGGDSSRTVTLHAGSGEFWVKKGGALERLL